MIYSNTTQGDDKVKYIFGSFGVIIIPVIVRGILEYLKYPKEAEKGKVYLPGLFGIMGIIVSTLFTVPMIITAFISETICGAVVCLVFSLLGVALVIAFVNCRIEYNEKGFSARSFFGIKREYTYNQVDAIKENMHESYIIAGKRKIMIDEFAVGGRGFITFVKKQYRKLNDGQSLPVVRKSKRDIFNGNVMNAGGFLFFYIFMSVLLIGFGIFMTYHIWFNPVSADNTVKREITLEARVIEDNKYAFTTSQGELYKIDYWNERTNRKDIENLCDGSTELTVFVKEIKTKQGTADYWSIEEIRYDSTVILSFEESNRLYKKNSAPYIFIPISFIIFWGLYITGSVIVGRNPVKYRKLVKLFFRKESINY